MRRHRSILPLLAAGLLAAPALLAAPITGTVHDGTTNKPSANDDVILISLQQRMQETARTKTDAKGHYSIDVPDAGMHLIRVDHQKASYFQPAPPNTTKVDVQVYDVAEKVPGVSTEANVLRIETAAQGLHVTQSFFVKNDSTPPRTQFSSHSYDIYLPADAKIEAAAAMGPGGMPVASSPAPAGDKGHYTYLFPLRPGETQFQVSYSLPYSGSTQFAPKLAGPTDNVVVILPKSMTFKPDASTPYQPINDDINAQTFVAKGVSATQALGFLISGTGTLPHDSQGAAGQNGDAAGASGTATASQDNRPGGGLGNPIDTPDPLSKYKYWILGAVGLVLAIAAALFLRRPSTTHEPLVSLDPIPQHDAPPAAERATSADRYPAREPYAEPEPDRYARDPYSSGSTQPERYVLPDLPPLDDRLPGPDRYAAREPYPVQERYVPEPPPAAPAAQRDTLLNALKEELFALETDRAQGNVGEVEYATHKQALETIIRRALNR